MTLASLSVAFMSAVCMIALAGLPAGAEQRALARCDTKRVESSLAYPQIGHARVDAALAHFAAQELERHIHDLEEALGPPTESGQGKPSRLEGHYTLFRPSPQTVSVLFELLAVSPHWLAPRRYFATRSYRLPAGEELTLADVFEDLPDALKVLAKQCSPKLLTQILEQVPQESLEMVWYLRSRLITPGHPMPDGVDLAEFSRRGGDAPAMRLLESVVRGTLAEPDNYKHFVLTPNGLRIQFEPLQLGGPETGAPHVDLSLKELRTAKPHLHLWGR